MAGKQALQRSTIIPEEEFDHRGRLSRQNTSGRAVRNDRGRGVVVRAKPDDCLGLTLALGLLKTILAVEPRPLLFGKIKTIRYWIMVYLIS